MKPMKLGVLLLAFLLAAMVMVPMVNAAATTQFVDSKTAQSVATSHMKDIAKISADYADWAKGAVQQSTTYYDLSNQKAAYLFNVKVNGIYSGYILVSATKDNYPVLEFSRGKVPDADPTILTRSNTAASESVKDQNLKTGSPTLLYLGGTFYYAQYPVMNSQGKVVDTEYVDLSNQKIVRPDPGFNDPLINSTSIAAHEQVKKTESEKFWQTYESDTGIKTTTAANKVIVTPAAVRTISGVPLWPYQLGCCPTSAGMILSYWRTHGYPNIPSSRGTLAQELYNAMGTTMEGKTKILNVDNGMNTVISNHGYSWNQLHIDEDTWVLWSDVTSEIDAIKPFVLTMTGAGIPVGGTQSYGDHSVAVVGYSNTGSGNFIIINDGLDATTTKYLAFNSWNGAVGGYSRPA